MAEDRMLAGYRTIDSIEHVQLFAGEKQPVSTQGVAASGNEFGEVDEKGRTAKFPVVAMVGGELVPWDPEDTAGAEIPVGILPHALDTTATGYNADVDTPYFVEGVFNFEALSVPTGTTYAETKAAFARTGITIQMLY